MTTDFNGLEDGHMYLIIKKREPKYCACRIHPDIGMDQIEELVSEMVRQIRIGEDRDKNKV